MWTNRPTDEGGAGGKWRRPTFFEIVLSEECFPGNLLLCHSPVHPKLFWPRHSQNLVGDPDQVISNHIGKATFKYVGSITSERACQVTREQAGQTTDDDAGKSSTERISHFASNQTFQHWLD